MLMFQAWGYTWDGLAASSFLTYTQSAQKWHTNIINRWPLGLGEVVGSYRATSTLALPQWRRLEESLLPCRLLGEPLNLRERCDVLPWEHEMVFEEPEDEN